MPFSPQKPCAYHGCSNLVDHGFCEEHKRPGGRSFPHDARIQKLYNSARWKERRHQQLEGEPYCRECLREGKMIKATDADHIEPHKGDEYKFFHGPLQSLCHAHHAAKTDRERAGG